MIEDTFLKITAYGYKILKKNPRDDIEKFIYHNAIVFNLFQLSIMIVFSIFFNVLWEFVGVFFIYGYIRKKGIMLHKPTPDSCFLWSNLTFVPEIVVMWLLKSRGIDLIPFIFFFGITNGLALSKNNKIVGLFAYASTDRKRMQAKVNRNKIRNHLYENFETDQVQETLKNIQKTTTKAVIEVAEYKYKNLLSNAEIAQSTKYNEFYVKDIDNILFSGFSNIL